MADDERPVEQDQQGEHEDVTETDETATDAGDSEPEGEDQPLGPKGEKALQAEKAKRRETTRKLRETQAELDRLRNGDDKAAEAAAEAERTATVKANARILRSEVKAAAAGRLADPKDALKLLDLDAFEVGEDGEVDEAEVADAITQLLKDKPYLQAEKTKRFQGGIDQGARKKAPARTIKDDIAEAEGRGDWKTARRLKTAAMFQPK